MNCTACEASDGRPVFRTNPPGQRPAGWMCRSCIEQYHDSSLIDADVQQLVDVLTAPAPPSTTLTTTNSVVTCTGYAA